MVIKSKQKDLRGKDAEEKSNDCYFCGNEVTEDVAERTKENLNEVICLSCVTKMLKLIFREGRRKLE